MKLLTTIIIYFLLTFSAYAWQPANRAYKRMEAGFSWVKSKTIFDEQWRNTPNKHNPNITNWQEHKDFCNALFIANPGGVISGTIGAVGRYSILKIPSLISKTASLFGDDVLRLPTQSKNFYSGCPLNPVWAKVERFLFRFRNNADDFSPIKAEITERNILSHTGESIGVNPFKTKSWSYFRKISCPNGGAKEIRFGLPEGRQITLWIENGNARIADNFGEGISVIGKERANPQVLSDLTIVTKNKTVMNLYEFIQTTARTTRNHEILTGIAKKVSKLRSAHDITIEKIYSVRAEMQTNPKVIKTEELKSLYKELGRIQGELNKVLLR